MLPCETEVESLNLKALVSDQTLVFWRAVASDSSFS